MVATTTSKVSRSSNKGEQNRKALVATAEATEDRWEREFHMRQQNGRYPLSATPVDRRNPAPFDVFEPRLQRPSLMKYSRPLVALQLIGISLNQRIWSDAHTFAMWRYMTFLAAHEPASDLKLLRSWAENASTIKKDHWRWMRTQVKAKREFLKNNAAPWRQVSAKKKPKVANISSYLIEKRLNVLDSLYHPVRGRAALVSFQGALLTTLIRCTDAVHTQLKKQIEAELTSPNFASKWFYPGVPRPRENELKEDPQTMLRGASSTREVSNAKRARPKKVATQETWRDMLLRQVHLSVTQPASGDDESSSLAQLWTPHHSYIDNEGKDITPPSLALLTTSSSLLALQELARRCRTLLRHESSLS